MAEALAPVLSLFGGSGGGLSSLAGVGSGLFGTIGNILANKTRNDVLQQQMNLTRKYQNLTPAQISTGIKGLEQPLSSGLTEGVGNIVQGDLAERGLSQSPGIYATALAQAIGPYQLQEQQIATDAYFKKLGLPISSRPSPFGPFPQTTNTSPIWQAMQQARLGTSTPGLASSSVLGYGGGIGDYAGGSSGDVGSLPFGNFDYNSLLTLIGQGSGGGSPALDFGSSGAAFQF